MLLKPNLIFIFSLSMKICLYMQTETLCLRGPLMCIFYFDKNNGYIDLPHNYYKVSRGMSDTYFAISDIVK